MRVKTIDSTVGLLATFKSCLWYVIRKNKESVECIAVIDFDISSKQLDVTYNDIEYMSRYIQYSDISIGYATDEEKTIINNSFCKQISVIGFGYIEKRILEKMINEAWYLGNKKQDKKQHDKNECLRQEVRDLLLKMSSTEIAVIPYILTTLKAIENLNLIEVKLDSYNNMLVTSTREQLLEMIRDMIYGVDNCNNLATLLKDEFKEYVEFNLSKIYPNYYEERKEKALRWLESFDNIANEPEKDDILEEEENEAVKTFEGLKNIAMPMSECDCGYFIGLSTVARNAILALTDDQITEMCGTWQELLDRKKGCSRREMQLLIDEVKSSATHVVDFVNNGGREFDDAVNKVRGIGGSWLGLVSWVEVKRLAKEMLVN